jgi:S1-C subfamily serine protease
MAMGEGNDVLMMLSHALAARADAAKSSVAAIRGRHGSLSGVLWRSDVLVTSAQSLPKRERYDVAFATGQDQVATPAGVDVTTNIAVLKLAIALQVHPLVGRVPNMGELVSAYGAGYAGSVSARLGTVIAVGDEWRSRTGGRIDKRLSLDIRLSRAEEGGPIFDMSGGFVGISTFGPYGRVIAIPASTLERVVPILLQHGHIARGWLGIALQPVAIPEPFRAETGQSAGLMATSVKADGPAAKAGVLAGDILVSVDGKDTRRFRNVLSSLDSDSVGRHIELRLIRSGAVQTLSLTVEARPKE